MGNHSENDEGIDAFSDTTSVDTSSAVSAHNNPASYTSNNPSQFSLDNYDDPFDFLGTVFGKGVLLFVIILLGLIGLLIFLAPLIALFMIIRYLYRRNQDRMKLSAMALEKGIEIPESARPIDKQSNEYLVKRGLRNAFLGAGLCAMFAIWGADFLAGIGALVLFMVQDRLPLVLCLPSNNGGAIGIVEKLDDFALVAKVVMFHDRKSFDLLVRKYQASIRSFFFGKLLEISN